MPNNSTEQCPASRYPSPPLLPTSIHANPNLYTGNWRGHLVPGHDPKDKILGILGMGGIGNVPPTSLNKTQFSFSHIAGSSKTRKSLQHWDNLQQPPRSPPLHRHLSLRPIRLLLRTNLHLHLQSELSPPSTYPLPQSVSSASLTSRE